MKNQIAWIKPLQQNEEISLTTSKEVANEIIININPKMSPGFDLITGVVLRQLPYKAIVKLSNLIYAEDMFQTSGK